MPHRAVFVTLEQAAAWIKDLVYEERQKQYRVYFEETMQSAVFEPKVSTDPITFGYIMNTNIDEMTAWSKQNPSIVVIPCHRYDWDSRKEP